MTGAEPLPCDVLPVADGVLVIPHHLLVHVPAGAYQLTVAEWLNLAKLRTD
ncbi:hypothetical protein HD597_000083 [Nonomuraea thailandensis]|uniref:Uncharacterized protein n=1 Tax=Nonomuraea thailandensis TaxID=1188745 RepID=A0A9X2JXT3_9ACTN|nr:hypothetical protein [Nonomuraea thailandensis]MCP2353063.1 hypothetical protein [Nonomuraea thailandensis]